MKHKAILALLGLALAWSMPSQASLINSGSAWIPGTFQFDFESGTISGVSPTADIFWNQLTGTTRQLQPAFLNSTAALLALGNTPFAGITETDLLGYVYSTPFIEGPPGGSLLDVGNTFAVLTAEGHYAKVEVTDYGTGTVGRDFYDIHIAYALFDGQPASVPEPGSFALLALGLAAATVARQHIHPGRQR
ncbi:hypothetical protein RD110_00230 [Rhodoferax koreense]|uniref:Ice-binding protein C-terminal domain-containing protein n=1 Tax=Rhodoferax koreensis TaxID=1842727 RepID=A0A1P8JQ16_9BURK|nr:PEP-CTERM sorting domain-containing protein [Rhodoferax koreense]APW35833.1 hypothetical protein RD110_00230 [Rhodoferax koreense]